MTTTHEAFIIKNGRSKNVIEVCRQACAEAKKKHRLPRRVLLNAVWHTSTPFGHVILVELPTRNGGERR